MKTFSAEYLKYLESQHWHDLRQQVFDKANRCCEACMSTKSLHGHHLVYRERLEDCTVEDIMALCKRCHDIWHKWRDNNKFRTFGREATRGAILVLLSIKEKPAVLVDRSYPAYFPETKPVKLSRAEQKKLRKERQKEGKKQRKAARASAVKDIRESPQFKAVFTESKTREEVRKKLNRMTVGFPRRALMMHWGLKIWMDEYAGKAKQLASTP